MGAIDDGEIEETHQIFSRIGWSKSTTEKSSDFNLSNLMPLIFCDGATSCRISLKIENQIPLQHQLHWQSMEFWWSTFARSASTYHHEYFMNFSLNFIKLIFTEKIAFTFYVSQALWCGWARDKLAWTNESILAVVCYRFLFLHTFHSDLQRKCVDRMWNS